MSQLNLYLKEKGELKELKVPVYLVKDLITEGLPTEEVGRLQNRAKPTTNILPFDAGSLCIDFDRKEIISSQRGFSREDLNGEFEKNLKEWKFIEQINYQELPQ